MQDLKYCYPNSDVLINKLNIKDKRELFQAEVSLTSIRLRELQENPIKGNFDFKHLKDIHSYIFQDLYEWAGQERTVEIGKGNLFCTVACIPDYSRSVFDKYFTQCYAAKDSFEDFTRVLADNYGDLNALHPFREGNGRAQREFARSVCRKCGYDFELSGTTHKKMLEASKLSFNKADNTAFVKIFSKALSPAIYTVCGNDKLKILTADDLVVGSSDTDEYYGYEKHKESNLYNEIYKAKIKKMDAEKELSEAKEKISQYKVDKHEQQIKYRTRKVSQDLDIEF